MTVTDAYLEQHRERWAERNREMAKWPSMPRPPEPEPAPTIGLTTLTGSVGDDDYAEMQRVAKRARAKAEIEAELAKQEQQEAKARADSFREWRKGSVLGQLLTR